MDKIDWNLAPENCVGAVQYKESSEFFKQTSPYGVFVCHANERARPKYRFCSGEGIYPCMEDFYFIPKPELKPTYTQAMADAGELPSVGMECGFGNGVNTVYIIVLPKDSEGDFILTPKKGKKYWQRSNIKYIKPIDARTDEEKAINSLNDFNLCLCHGWQEAMIGFIKSGEFHGVTWSGK